ncbi:MAG: hypothetical protein SFY96_13115 [Planctomycetota bacterium]|nr:hypothetical protein [Planctomycetota bacterium]
MTRDLRRRHLALWCIVPACCVALLALAWFAAQYRANVLQSRAADASSSSRGAP